MTMSPVDHAADAPLRTDLPHRGAFRLAGPDREPFLQGLVTQDVRLVSAGRAIYALFLTAQGKFLHDMFIVPEAESWLIETEAARLEDLFRRLRMYRLRSRIELGLAEDLRVSAITGAIPPVEGMDLEAPGAVAAPDGLSAFRDPREPALGLRLIGPADAIDTFTAGLDHAAGLEAYDRLRLSLGVPDGSRDLEVEKATAMESDLDRLQALSWDKGCYLGQELTARMKYRGLGKRRLMRVALDGPEPAPGTPVLDAEGREFGQMASAAPPWGLALLRLEALEVDSPLQADGTRIEPRPVAD